MSHRVSAEGPSIPFSYSRRSLHPDAGEQTMHNKRKLISRSGHSERRAKRQRLRQRSRSDPQLADPSRIAKRQALNRLFGRFCSVDMDSAPLRDDEEYLELEPEPETDPDDIGDENEDPLLDSVPVNMDPEQLGFLVCAQETLRFLHGRGIPPHHPMFARLRSRLLQGIGEMAVA